jgi:hypothetical protein
MSAQISLAKDLLSTAAACASDPATASAYREGENLILLCGHGRGTQGMKRSKRKIGES